MLQIRNKNSIRHRNIWGLDCENDPDTGEFKLGVIWKNDADYIVFHDPEKMAKYLYKPHSVIITGLNIAYDLNLLHPFFRPYRLERVGKLITCDMARNTAGKQIKNLKANGHRSRYIEIMDIGNFIQNKSLKQCAKDFGISHIDIHDWQHPRIEEACISHARAGAIILRELQKMFASMGGEIKLTGSSTSLNLFQQKYLQPEHQIYDDQGEHELDQIKRSTNNGYFGGRTEIFYRGLVHNATCIDIVSSYPTVMVNHVYPDMNTAVLIENPGKNFELTRTLEQFEGSIKCTVNHPDTIIPILPIKQNGKLIFPTGIFTGTWTFPELRYFLSEGGKILKLHEIVTCKRVYGFFDEYINAMFEFKQQTDTKPAAKLAMNGLSGKFGQTDANDSFYAEIEDCDVVDVEKYFEMDGVKYQYQAKDTIFSFNKKAYPLIVAYVTSYARINLRKQMENIGYENVLYCDTDSIIYRDIGQKILNAGPNLGQWEIKFTGKWEGRTLKNYRYKETLKCYWQYVSKGIPGPLQSEFWKHNEVWQMTPVKLKSAIRRNMKLGKWGIIKKVQGAYQDKRVFDMEGNSTALKLNEVIK